jgi:hypothetical protein
MVDKKNSAMYKIAPRKSITAHMPIWFAPQYDKFIGGKIGLERGKLLVCALI